MSLLYGAPNTTPLVDDKGLITPLWAAFFDSFLASTNTSTVPTGVVAMFDGSDVPPGWLFCDGQEVSRRTYADLFKALGTRFGPGDGSTTFNLPDRRGTYPKGTFNVGVVTDGGDTSYTLTVANLPSITVDINDPGHTHTFTGDPTAVSVNDPGHVHSLGATTANTGTNVVGTDPVYTGTNTGNAVTGISIPNITPLGHNSEDETGITASIAGPASAPLTIDPPYVTTAYIIKT